MKWILNVYDVIQLVLVFERVGFVKEFDFENLFVECVFGIQWDVQLDIFCFKIVVKD